MIQFKKVIIHNFGSYGHAELELQNRGFCLVSGQNNYTKDNALSNGSGKSFLWSAVCYAMTGETINGIKANLKNINSEDNDCYVQLDFLYNKDLYSLYRTAAPKSDLKIFKNDIDVSGKGIRESEKKLQELLPDLTKDLIASTIIIGQGMPNKFSSFSPSGRKELLEKLTKSDFMIEDLKSRIQQRQLELNTIIREFEDSLLANKTQLNNYLARLDQLKSSINSRVRPDFATMLSEHSLKISSVQAEINADTILITETEQLLDSLNVRLVSLSDEKAKVSEEELSAYTERFMELSNEQNSLNTTIKMLQSEITKLRSITDICPTCGQHLPNVKKPDTSVQEMQLNDAKNTLLEITEKINVCNSQHKMYVDQINAAFSEELASLNAGVLKAKQDISTARKTLAEKTTLLESLNLAYNKILYDQQNWDTVLENTQKEITVLENDIAKLTNLIAVTSISKGDLDQRIAIIRKMDSLIKRDFRGYLLTNIINYIDVRSKEYCSTVFGTRELSLALNGNALDITYCGKPFDGLSGGEKQRVDLILQLAIRDLLTSYLGLSANILVLDEVTDFLDKKSCAAVMQLLEKELKTVESVFIISHHSEELELPVDSEIRVIKNEHGISELF